MADIYFYLCMNDLFNSILTVQNRQEKVWKQGLNLI